MNPVTVDTNIHNNNNNNIDSYSDNNKINTVTIITITIGELLEQTEIQFEAANLAYGHGTNNAFDDACVLLRHALQLPYDTDLTEERWTHTVPAANSDIFAKLVQRRITERVPTPYLTGMAYVQGVALYTDPAVIVPRSLLGELLFSGNLDEWLPQTPNHILDLCTGSGAIAIQAALVYETAQIDAVDIEAVAIALAKRNIKLHGLNKQINLYQGDLFAPLKHNIRYDLILTNPPYVNTDSMVNLPDEYRAEPILALAGGIDGMNIVRHIIAQAKQYLTPQGVLVIEIGFEAAYFEAAFPTLPCIYLPVTEGDDLIVMIEAQHLNITD